MSNIKEENGILSLEEDNNTYILDLNKLKEIPLSLRLIPPCLSFADKKIFSIPVKVEFEYSANQAIVKTTALLSSKQKYSATFPIDKEFLFMLIKSKLKDHTDITAEILKDIDYVNILSHKITATHPTFIKNGVTYTQPIALLNENKIVCISKNFYIDEDYIIHLLSPIGTWNTEFKNSREQIMILCYLNTADFVYVKFADLENATEAIVSLIDDKTPVSQSMSETIARLKEAAAKEQISIEQYIVNQIHQDLEEQEVLDF